MNKKEEFNASKMNYGPRGWLLVIYGLAISFFATCTADSLKQLALLDICTARGWDYYDITSIAALFGWINLIAYRAIGKVLQKYSVRKVGMIILPIFAITVATILHMQSQIAFIGIYYLFTAAMGMVTQLVIPTYINNWFPRKKGVIIGITTAGFPAGACAGIALYYFLERTIGAQAVYFFYAGVFIVITILAAIFLPDYPEECGGYPDNDPSVSREEANKILAAGKVEVDNSFWTTKRLLTTPQFWMVLIACGLTALCNNSFTSCLVPRMLAAGYDRGAAVGFVSIAMICGAVGSFVIGFVDSKIGPRNTLTVMGGLALTACILNIIPGTFTAVAAMVFIGCIMGGAANMLMSTTTSMWGRYTFRSVYGLILPINELFGSLGKLLTARAAKSALGFNLAYGLAAVFAIIVIVVSRMIKLDSIKKIEVENGVDILH